MYPVIRSLLALRDARRHPSRDPGQASTVTTRVWPWDADVFMELNNGRHLTLFDVGRFHHGARLGLIPVLRREGWGLAVGGAWVQYRKRIRLFERFAIRTRLVARDSRWFYFEQTTLKGDTPCSSALLRVAVIDGPKGAVETDRVARALGFPDWQGRLPDWAARMEAADRDRP
ncbi:MAG: acyl-CoA thioesterase, partial [Pseudomonadota bacterium]